MDNKNNKRKSDDQQDDSNKKRTNEYKRSDKGDLLNGQWKNYPTVSEITKTIRKRQILDNSGSALNRDTRNFLNNYKKYENDENYKKTINDFERCILDIDPKDDAKGDIMNMKRIINSGGIKNFLIRWTGEQNNSTGYAIYILSIKNQERYYTTIVLDRNVYAANVMSAIEKLKSQVGQRSKNKSSVNNTCQNTEKANPNSEFNFKDSKGFGENTRTDILGKNENF